MKSKRVPGYFYRRNQRWWWQVRLPGQATFDRHPMIPGGGTQATKDWPAAQEIARRMYERAVFAESKAQGFDKTVAGLIQRFLEHAREYYVDPESGLPTREVVNLKYAADLLLAECPTLKIDEFGPLKLKAIRQKLVDDVKGDGSRRYCRNLINQRVGIIKRIFAWGAEEELVSGSIFHGLQAVKGLARGRTRARETAPIRPVSEDVVRRTMKFASPVVADMIELQLLTGMRPGELLILRTVDLDISGQEWTYRPEHHKTERFGHSRIVPLGPRAQQILKRYIRPKVDAYLFSPAEATEARYAVMREARQTKVQPSQADRRNPEAVVLPGDRYDTWSYGRAVQYAIKKANKAGETIPHWHPNQIRHLVATVVRKEFGLDAARALLSHKTLGLTDTYAELDLGQASQAVRKLG